MKIGYLGPEGTFSHEALLANLGDGAADVDPVALAAIHDVVLSVHEGAVDRALVPIENSLEGSVNATLDALAGEADDVVLIGEAIHRVRHCLVAPEPVELRALEAVVSHPQANAQCAHFIRTELPWTRVLAAPSTAEAVRMVAQDRPPGGISSWSALGTATAAHLYGCAILREGVEDDDANETRFVWLARASDAPGARGDGARWKTSLVFQGAGDESAGWLVRCLSEFAFRGVNLTRIESRPSKRGLGSYRFFVDLDGREADTAVAEAVEALRGQAGWVKLLGSYPAA